MTKGRLYTTPRVSSPDCLKMKFEVSDRIPTNANRESLLKALEEQLSKVSENVRRDGDSYVAEMIEATFGSINRKDITTVELRDSDDGFLIVGNVDYRPSTWFWVLLIILLFTYIGWIIPVAFYLLHKNTVKNAIQGVFTRIKNEFTSSSGQKQKKLEYNDLDQLEKLADLKDKGAVTEEEFQTKKKELLGLDEDVLQSRQSQASPRQSDTTPPQSVRFCSKCGTEQKENAKFCHSCGDTFAPQAPSTIKTECPSCQQHLSVPGEMRGQSVDCPSCNSKFSVS